MASLTAKQQRFVEEYLLDLNATQAAIRAGYSTKTANRIASQNLSKLYIQDAITKRRVDLQTEFDLTPEKVIAEYMKIGFANMGDYVTWNKDRVDLTNSEDLTANQLAAVAEVSETRGEKTSSIRFKLHDKKGALDSLAKTLAMFVERQEHTGKDGGALTLKVVYDDSD